MLKKIGFFVSNRVELAQAAKADGIYIPANNNDLNLGRLKYANFKIIGAAHNLKELNIKNTKCSYILYSRLLKLLINLKRVIWVF